MEKTAIRRVGVIILRQARQAQSLYLNPSPLIGALIMYLIILLPLVWLGNYFESRFKEV